MKQLYFLLIGCAFLIWACKHDPFPYDGPGGGNNNPVAGENPCDPDTVYFQNTILPLLLSNCTYSGCHSGSNPADGILLTDYNSIITDGDVRAGRPGNSDLYEVITETRNDKRMPPPPYPPLSAQEIEAVRRWINQGAKNNFCDDCDTSNIRFVTHIAPIFQKNCEGCHSGSAPSGGVLLTNHGQVTNAITTRNLLDAIKHTPGFKAMPPNNKISDCEIGIVESWIKDGMPDN